MTTEVKIRRTKMVAAFSKLSVNLFANKKINLSTKLKGFVTFIINCGLYGCATWNIKQSEITKLEYEQYWLLRSIFGYRWFHMKSFADLIKEAELVGVRILPIEAYIRMKRLTYFGHVCRMEDSRLPKIILHSECMEGKRIPGGQECNYKKCVKEDLIKFNIPTIFAELSQLVQDRLLWRRSVKTNGIKYFMEQWVLQRQKARNERIKKREQSQHQVADIEKIFSRNDINVPVIVRLERALHCGAITVGRGEIERTGKSKAKSFVQSTRISFVKSLFLAAMAAEMGVKEVATTKKTKKKVKAKKIMSEQELEDERARESAYMKYVYENFF
jgi:hypothetical protein